MITGDYKKLWSRTHRFEATPQIGKEFIDLIELVL